MIIEVGHVDATDGPVVTMHTISDVKNEDGNYLESYKVGTDAQEIRNHLFDHPGVVSHLGGNTAVLAVNPIRDRVQGKPTWVSVDAQERDPAEAADFERFLSDFWGCPRGKPADVEDTHFTLHNNEVFPPGTSPGPSGV